MKKITYSGLFAAMIFALTRFVYIPAPSGYINFGDTLIYIVASTLGGPWALLSASIGGMLADLSSGYAVYAPATIIIKALIALPFVLVNKKSNKIISKFTLSFTVISGIITVLGYFVADLIIDKAYAVVDLPGNIIQAVCSAVFFIIISAALDKAKVKQRFFREI